MHLISFLIITFIGVIAVVIIENIYKSCNKRLKVSDNRTVSYVFDFVYGLLVLGLGVIAYLQLTKLQS